MPKKFLDAVSVAGVKETADGYLVADAFAVRTGVQRYAGFELDQPDQPFIDVYRSEDQVFSRASLASFAHIPITNDHPSVAVTAENWKDLAVGETSTEVLRDGERLRIPLIVKDKATVDLVKAGKRQLSAGYTCDLLFEDGRAPDGTPYQARQTNIRANHIAIVQRGRAGPEFRIGDGEDWGAAPLMKDEEHPPMTTRNLTIDGITIAFTDQGAEAVGKLQERIGALTADNLQLVTTHTAALAAKDTEIGELKAKLAEAEKKVPDSRTLDALASARADLIQKARALVKDLKTDGLSDADIRKAAVTAALGEDLVKDASDAEIGGMFKALKAPTTAGAPHDPVRHMMMTRDTRARDSDDTGQEAYERRVADAWKPAAARQQQPA
jgi:hypothetical protein